MRLLHVEQCKGKSEKFHVSNTIFKRYLSLLSRTKNYFKRRYGDNNKRKRLSKNYVLKKDFLYQVSTLATILA